MKKTYIAPEMNQMVIGLHAMICNSITQDGDNLNVTINDDTPGDFGAGNTINGRTNSIWDSEE